MFPVLQPCVFARKVQARSAQAPNQASIRASRKNHRFNFFSSSRAATDASWWRSTLYVCIPGTPTESNTTSIFGLFFTGTGVKLVDEQHKKERVLQFGYGSKSRMVDHRTARMPVSTRPLTDEGITSSLLAAMREQTVERERERERESARLTGSQVRVKARERERGKDCLPSMHEAS